MDTKPVELDLVQYQPVRSAEQCPRPCAVRAVARSEFAGACFSLSSGVKPEIPVNAPDELASSSASRANRCPLPPNVICNGSQDIQVPLREIMQSNGEAVTVYYTLAPTPTTSHIDVR